MDSPSFTFRLERLRALRERGEDIARRRYAESLAHHRQGEVMLASLDEHLAGTLAGQRQAAAAPRSGEDLRGAQAYLERVERAREAGALDLDRRDAELDARQDALRAAARERQSLERLKARRRADHARVSSRREGALLDEIAVTRHARATGS